MIVYDTVLRYALELPLSSVEIVNDHVKERLYWGSHGSLPRNLFECEVSARFYDEVTKTLKLWVH